MDPADLTVIKRSNGDKQYTCIAKIFKTRQKKSILSDGMTLGPKLSQGSNCYKIQEKHFTSERDRRGGGGRKGEMGKRKKRNRGREDGVKTIWNS